MSPRFVLPPKRPRMNPDDAPSVDSRSSHQSHDVLHKHARAFMKKRPLGRLDILVTANESPLSPSLNLYHSIGLSVDAEESDVSSTLRSLRAAFHPDRPLGSLKVFGYLESVKQILVDSRTDARRYRDMLKKPYFPHGGALLDVDAMREFLERAKNFYAPREFPGMRNFTGPSTRST